MRDALEAHLKPHTMRELRSNVTEPSPYIYYDTTDSTIQIFLQFVNSSMIPRDRSRHLVHYGTVS